MWQAPAGADRAGHDEDAGHDQELALDQFGVRLLHAAVTPARVEEMVRRLVGDRIRVAPVRVGPAGVASAAARGRLGPVTAEPEPGDPRRLRVRVPVSLAVTVRLGGRATRFLAHATIALALTVRPAAPLAIHVDVAEPAERDVTLRLFLPKLAHRLLVGLVDVELELNRHIREYISQVLASPAARQYTHIDLGNLIDLAWDHELLGRPPDGKTP